MILGPDGSNALQKKFANKNCNKGDYSQARFTADTSVGHVVNVFGERGGFELMIQRILASNYVSNCRPCGSVLIMMASRILSAAWLFWRPRLQYLPLTELVSYVAVVQHILRNARDLLSKNVMPRFVAALRTALNRGSALSRQVRGGCVLRAVALLFPRRCLSTACRRTRELCRPS